MQSLATDDHVYMSLFNSTVKNLQIWTLFVIYYERNDKFIIFYNDEWLLGIS